MSNFHTKEWMMSHLQNHYNDAKTITPESNIIGVFYYGSGLYGLDYERSDVDSKCIIASPLPPNTRRVVVREDDTTITFVEISKYLKWVIGGCSWAIDIMFAEASIINPAYEALWKCIENERETITAKCGSNVLKGLYNSYNQTVSGTCIDTGKPQFKRFGHSTKALCHTARLAERIVRTHRGEGFRETMVSQHADFLISLKRDGCTLDEAIKIRDAANNAIASVTAEPNTMVRPDFKYFSQFDTVIDKMVALSASLGGDTSE